MSNPQSPASSSANSSASSAVMGLEHGVRATTDAAGQDRLRLSHLSRRTSGRLRRSTLVTLRWIAIIGQILSLFIVHQFFGLPFDFRLTAAVIAVSVLLNLGIGFSLPLDRRVGDTEAMLQLGFDTVQLAALLGLTGGMTNPFAVLLIAPVVMSATTLSLRVLLCIFSFAALSSLFLMFNHHPLPWDPAGSFTLPPRYHGALWLALVTTMVFTSAYTWQAAREGQRMSEALASTEAVLAQEQKLAALGGLAAAAAHELGTPLATIALVAGEIAREVAPETPLGEDAKLLVEQSARCGEILKQLGSRGDTGEPVHDSMSLEALLSEAAAPYIGLGSTIEIDTHGTGVEPTIKRQAEILYGLKNFIENAVEFADGRVVLSGSWTETALLICIQDDGPGFAPSVIGRLGEPYVSVRGEANQVAGGLGLGVFIAKTLIERTGGTVGFSNTPKTGGAEVELSWALDDIMV